jgi:hypothetical protein
MSAILYLLLLLRATGSPHDRRNREDEENETEKKQWVKQQAADDPEKETGKQRYQETDRHPLFQTQAPVFTSGAQRAQPSRSLDRQYLECTTDATMWKSSYFTT